MAERVRAVVTGRVQGVGYRDFACREATSLGLAGWVRNRRDGSVEVVAEGPPAALQRLIARLHTGPPAARVESVEVSAAAARNDLAGFQVAPTD